MSAATAAMEDGTDLSWVRKPVGDELLADLNKGISEYRDFHFQGSSREQEEKLLQSKTLYVGNMSFYTTEEQVHELFSCAGEVKRVIMGLDRIKKTPCGFCFVEYFTREAAELCMASINGTKLDDRVIRTDWDAGFKDGRQFGRGRSGGQVRDDIRRGRSKSRSRSPDRPSKRRRRD